ncbi:hypothetical protein [Nitrobacter hamburgensis]|uniref:hypothetical protein n=1 Tax=Nitrobacter hamburgensis TaxID=912 RepID=UPI0002D82B9F|nr:hypothetical protein [Nitrobacter hamburgensis]
MVPANLLALLRTLADARDTLAFGAFMRGPMVWLTDEELPDSAEEVRATTGGVKPGHAPE